MTPRPGCDSKSMEHLLQGNYIIVFIIHEVNLPTIQSLQVKNLISCRHCIISALMCLFVNPKRLNLYVHSFNIAKIIIQYS